MRKTLLLVLLILAASAGASPLFDDNAVVNIEIAGPFSGLVRNKEDREELPFRLSANGITHDVELRAAGKSRMQVCTFPMLRVDFVKDATDGSLFEGQNKVRLVTHCRRSDAAHADVLQEFLTYRIFNELTDVSYRVRLVDVAYVDTDNGSDTTRRYGFFLEPKEGPADRFGGEALEIPGVSLASLDDDHMALVYVFQYLIANTDWSLALAFEDDACCHNGNLIEIDGTRYYLPYDFDQAGLVNARHARPDPGLRLRNVTQRRYRGFCIDNETLRRALGTVRSKETDILTIVDELPALSSRDRKSTRRYLEKFFAEARKEDRLLASFKRRCIKG